MCDLSHHDAVPRDAAVPADGGGGAAAAPGLVAVRHGTRGLPPEAHDVRATGGRVRVVLPPAVFAPLDLAPAPRRPPGRPRVPGDVVPVQARQLALARPHPAPAGVEGVAPARGTHAPAPPAVPEGPALAPCGRVPSRGRDAVRGSVILVGGLRGCVIPGAIPILV